MLDFWKQKDYAKLLKKGAQRAREVLGAGTNCFRVYDCNIPEIPVTVEQFAKCAKITSWKPKEWDESDKALVISLTASNLYIDKSDIVWQDRHKLNRGEQHGVFEVPPKCTEVKEGGHTFFVELAQKVDTGLFLDNSLSRLVVEEASFGKDVLNLFCYTGSYSVYAASGGAKSVVSVDSSQTALDAARRNMKQNGFTEGEVFQFVKSDVKEYLDQEKPAKFDLIIFDAPSFSVSHGSQRKFDIAKDYPACLALCWNLLRNGGAVLFQTNLGDFRLSREAIQGFKLENLTSTLRAPNFTRKSKCTQTWVLRKISQKERRSHSEDRRPQLKDRGLQSKERRPQPEDRHLQSKERHLESKGENRQEGKPRWQRAKKRNS